MPSESFQCKDVIDLLIRIDGEIDQLLRKGKLSALNYDIAVSDLATKNRTANLKALLDARRYYREQIRSGDDVM